MFPAFTPYILNAVANNVNPCEVDVVGNTLNPAVFFGINATNIAFRFRLNGDPQQNSLAGLQPARWGVQIKDISNNFLFAIEVDAKNAPPKVLVRDSSFNQIDNKFELISLGTNVVVTPINPGSFSCNSAQPPDSDFFLDFTLPLTLFSDLFDFNNTVFSFCFYTSTAAQENVINKEDPDVLDTFSKCGPPINFIPPGRGIKYWDLKTR